MIAKPSHVVPQIYEQIVKPLTAVEQITLARLILADLTASYTDDSTEWSEQDLREWSHSGRQYIEAVLGEAEDA
jgi:hypothetical protein